MTISYLVKGKFLGQRPLYKALTSLVLAALLAGLIPPPAVHRVTAELANAALPPPWLNRQRSLKRKLLRCLNDTNFDQLQFAGI